MGQAVDLTNIPPPVDASTLMAANDPGIQINSPAPPGGPEGMSDEELMAAIKAQTANTNVPSDPSTMSDEDLLSAIKAQQGNDLGYKGDTPSITVRPEGQPVRMGQLPTGPSAILPEAEKQTNEAMDMNMSGARDVGSAFTPVTALAKMAAGKKLDPDEEGYLDQDALFGVVSPAWDLVKGLGKGTAGALGLLGALPSGVNRGLVGNEVENKTGIPSGAVDFAMSLGEPWALAKLGSATKIGSKLSALYDMMKGAPEAQEAAAAAPAVAPAPIASTGQKYNVVNEQGRQATANDTVADFAGKDKVPPPDTKTAAGEVAGDTAANPVADAKPFPMTAGEATQNPTLQRIEADSLAGARGPAAQQAMLQARAAKAQAAQDSISQLGKYRPDGTPSDSFGPAVGAIRANEGVAKEAVNAAYNQARTLGANVTIPANDAAQNLVPDMAQVMSQGRFNATTAPKATAMYEDLLKTIGGDGKTPLAMPVALADGEEWRSAATQMAANSSDRTEATALRKMIGVYDNYMTGLSGRLQGGSADAINAYKEAVASRAEYGQRYEGNDLVQNIIGSKTKSVAGGNGMSVDDLTKQFIGNGSIAGRSGMLDDVNSLLRAAGDDAPLVRQHLQDAFAQNLYDKTAGAKVAGTDVNGINFGALQTHLENLFVKQREAATSIFGNETVANAQEAIKQLDLINSKQPNVGNVSNSGYTALRLMADHAPGFGWISKGLNAMKEAQAGKEAAQLAKGVVPSHASSLPAARLGPAMAVSGAADRGVQ